MQVVVRHDVTGSDRTSAILAMHHLTQGTVRRVSAGLISEKLP